MSAQATANLRLPLLMPSQAQKHVTHNEALGLLDALVQISVGGFGVTQPPAAPADGDRLVVGTGAAGEFGGHDGSMAVFGGGAWQFLQPRKGWLVWDGTSGQLHVFDGAVWRSVGLLDGTTPALGINAAADGAQRLAVKSDAVLLSHDDVSPGSGDMRAKLNKADAGKTASLLFQTGFSGRAEIGTAGDDGLHVKVSADGAAWREALVIDPASGRIGVGTGAPAAALDVAGPARCQAMTLNSADDPQALPLHFARNGSVRWMFGLSADASGSNLVANAFADDGKYTGTPFTIERATRVVKLSGPKTYTTDLLPVTDNLYRLGAASVRFAEVWVANGAIQTSDCRDKEAIAAFDPQKAAALVDAVEPITFRWRVGGHDVVGTDPETHEPMTEPRAGHRTHAGFRAQDIRAAMDAEGLDFGAWGLVDPGDPHSGQWLRPDQLVAVLWAALRDTRRRLAALEQAPAG